MEKGSGERGREAVSTAQSLCDQRLGDVCEKTFQELITYTQDMAWLLGMSQSG